MVDKEHTIEHKCIACFDTGIINKGTKVEEKCPVCEYWYNRKRKKDESEKIFYDNLKVHN